MVATVLAKQTMSPVAWRLAEAYWIEQETEPMSTGSTTCSTVPRGLGHRLLYSG